MYHIAALRNTPFAIVLWYVVLCCVVLFCVVLCCVVLCLCLCLYGIGHLHAGVLYCVDVQCCDMI